jgi:hypothetical protein
MSVETRELYSSANGDRWFLAHETVTRRVFIKHEANVPSGGQATDIDIGEFLRRGGQGPEHQALLRLIGTFVTEDRPALAGTTTLAKTTRIGPS